MALRIRSASANDTELIARLHIESWRNAYQGMLPREYLEDRLEAERLEHWRSRMPSLIEANGTVAIAECDGQSMGFVCLEAPDQEGSVLVDNLHARPHLKGRGIGSALLVFARGWARQYGATMMHLFVLESNLAARAFYAAQGWRETKKEQDVMAGIDIVHLRLNYLL
jgi:GNAT superfamily N-acetyltransferase